MLAWLVLLAPALAGDIVVQTSVPAEIQLGGQPLLQTWGPATLRVTDIDPGLASIRVVRGEQTQDIDVMVPDEGAATLVVGQGAPSTHPTAAPAPGPSVELRATAGQKFSVIVDGKRTTVVRSQHPVRLEGITAGPHTLELRTVDLTVVWAKANLDLVADDQVVITGQEGYAPEVKGREGAVRLAGAAADVPSGAAPGDANAPVQTFVRLPDVGDPPSSQDSDLGKSTGSDLGQGTDDDLGGDIHP